MIMQKVTEPNLHETGGGGGEVWDISQCPRHESQQRALVENKGKSAKYCVYPLETINVSSVLTCPQGTMDLQMKNIGNPFYMCQNI